MNHVARVIDVSPPQAEDVQTWATALALAQRFGADESWALIGGLMVQLHGYERGRTARPTSDIDLLGDSRKKMTQTMSETIIEQGGEIAHLNTGDPALGYAFEIDGAEIEILGSEGLQGNPKTIGNLTTIQVPGGTQALRRAEPVLVSLCGSEPVSVRRPSLAGAILIKARAVALKREKFASDSQDTVQLLSYVEEPREMASELSRTEKSWLKAVRPELDFPNLELGNFFSREDITLAEQALNLLVGEL